MPPSVWGWYAARVVEQLERQGLPVVHRRAFEDAVAADGLRRLREQAERWWSMFDVTPARLAEALVDETAPRYAKRR
jgi:hypothetical protein